MLHAFERKILIIIYGPIRETGQWLPRQNSKIHSLHKDLNIMHDIKIIKLGCTGHIIRMEHERIPKKILMENSTTQDQQENQEQDGRKLSREMHYRCSEYEDGGDELGIEKEWRQLSGRQWPSKVLWHHGWMGGLLKQFCDMTKTRKLKCIGGYINIQFRNQTYRVYQDE